MVGHMEKNKARKGVIILRFLDFSFKKGHHLGMRNECLVIMKSPFGVIKMLWNYIEVMIIQLCGCNINANELCIKMGNFLLYEFFSSIIKVIRTGFYFIFLKVTFDKDLKEVREGVPFSFKKNSIYEQVR